MISLYKIENTKLRPDGDYISVELRGLSTDEKPTEWDGKKIDNGSAFVEIDTGDIHFFDIESKEWK
ncbi:hypothetical protein IKN40_04455 [bacterium]|nr:hypothetical protein [bacterium]